MKTVIFVVVCAVFCVETTSAQFLSEPVVSPNILFPSSTAEIRTLVGPHFAPEIQINIYVNEIMTSSVVTVFFAATTLVNFTFDTSPYANRSRVVFEPPVFDSTVGFNFTFELNNISLDDDNIVIRFDVNGFERRNYTTTLNVVAPVSGCPPLESPIRVVSNSTTPGSRGRLECFAPGHSPYDGDVIRNETVCEENGGWEGLETTRCLPDCLFPPGGVVGIVANSTARFSRGTFTCPGSGELPFDGEDFRNETFCNEQGNWDGFVTTRCLSAPEVNITIQSSGNTFIGNCIFQVQPGLSQRSIFYLGGVGHEVSGSLFFAPPFTADLFGTNVSCQAVTPYTRLFNDTGRSKSFPFIEFEEPSQNEVTCSWRFGQSEDCNVTFVALPAVEFLGLGKNGSLVDNDANNTVTVSGKNHTYRFQRQQVTEGDFGEYRLVVRYVQFPGIRYVVIFNIIEDLPNITATSCIWFFGQAGSCLVNVDDMRASAVVLLRNDEVIGNESTLTITNSQLRYDVNQASAVDEGNYSLTLRLSPSSSQFVSFQIYVRDYPFNPAAVIGITLAVLVLILIGFALFALSLRKKDTKKNGQVELLEKSKKPYSQGTMPKSPTSANHATPAPTSPKS